MHPQLSGLGGWNFPPRWVRALRATCRSQGPPLPPEASLCDAQVRRGAARPGSPPPPPSVPPAPWGIALCEAQVRRGVARACGMAGRGGVSGRCSLCMSEGFGWLGASQRDEEELLSFGVCTYWGTLQIAYEEEGTQSVRVKPRPRVPTRPLVARHKLTYALRRLSHEL